MPTRPTSVTVISWILIVLGVLALPFMALGFSDPKAQEIMAINPIPIPIQYAMAFGGTIASIVCGCFMLQGKNWARLVYVGWSAFGFLLSLITSPMKIALIPSLVIFLLIAFFLFRPAANRFFTGTGADVEGP
jgi:hypothetical protein